MPLQRAIRKLEQLQENTEPRGNSASNIMRETGNFLQHDLQEIIDILQDAQNEMESKTTPKVAPSEVV
ncbi:hypothetical protein BK131_04315 [Paenibacillus amylolyticus]|uniref:Uncharacterized protein n=1 Tax=Paenibacillus amylolyticus TaxID=1451 RepID=A0A1R1C506_PAEAM|nr:hypothetical protein [Paenibacillus amylolyticus]OMF17196.1 hypothetical protein BK131_04315 [Paenibacillus amylolyticus]